MYFYSAINVNWGKKVPDLGDYIFICIVLYIFSILYLKYRKKNVNDKFDWWQYNRDSRESK